MVRSGMWQGTSYLFVFFRVFSVRWKRIDLTMRRRAGGWIPSSRLYIYIYLMYMRIAVEIDVATAHQSPPTAKSVRARLQLEIESIFYAYRPIPGWWRPFCPRFRINHGWITQPIYLWVVRVRGVEVMGLEWYKYAVLYFSPRTAVSRKPQ